MVRIERLNFQERAFSRRQFRHYVQEMSAYVVSDRFVVFGYIVVFSRRNSNTARINVISIDPKYTGNGYGTLLLNYAENLYNEYDYMSLEVNAENKGAVKLYASRGYEAKKVLTDYYGPGTTGIKMVKPLK